MQIEWRGQDLNLRDDVPPVRPHIVLPVVGPVLWAAQPPLRASCLHRTRAVTNFYQVPTTVPILAFMKLSYAANHFIFSSSGHVGSNLGNFSTSSRNLAHSTSPGFVGTGGVMSTADWAAPSASISSDV